MAQECNICGDRVGSMWVGHWWICWTCKDEARRLLEEYQAECAYQDSIQRFYEYEDYREEA